MLGFIKTYTEQNYVRRFAYFILFKYVIIISQIEHFNFWERSGSVVECLNRDRRAAGLSLTGVTALWSLSKTHLSWFNPGRPVPI